MSEINYMVVDGTLPDLVAELTSYMDTLDGSSGSLESTCAKLLTSADDVPTELFSAIAKEVKVLAKASEAQFESSWQLALHVLSFGGDEVEQEVVPTVLQALSGNESLPRSFGGPAAAGAAVIAVTSSLFNMLPETSALRALAFETALNTAEATGNLHVLGPQLKNTEVTGRWLSTWEVEEETRQKLIGRVFKALTALDDHKKALAILLHAVQAAGNSTYPLTCKLVQEAIKNEDVYDFSELLALDAVQDLKNGEARLFELLTTLASGDVQATETLVNGPGKSLIDDNDLDGAQIIRKAKITALANLSSKHHLGKAEDEPPLQYSEIAKTLNVPEEEVELWVIDAIRAGLVEGRLSQTKQSFAIHRASPAGPLGPAEWKLVDERLSVWKNSLRDVLEVVKQARENANKAKKVAA